MWFDLILLIAFFIFAIFQAVFLIVLPLGTEGFTFRRLPWVTFSIMAINVVVYFVCLPATVQQDKVEQRAFGELAKYVDDNQQILADERVRAKLREIGQFRDMVQAVDDQMKKNPDLQDEYKEWLRGADAARMRDEIEKRIARYREVADEHLYNKYGIAGAGQWKVYQFITHAFMHGNTQAFGLVFPLHLFFNLIALFAIGMSLEDLWGRSVFLIFYLMGAVIAAIPEAATSTVPMIGASGAIATTMGAFLVRLPNTKLRIGWLLNPFAVPILFIRMMLGRKPWGIVHIKGYFYLAYWITNQLLFSWYFNYKLGANDGVSYKTHITGFIFGAGFAYLLKATNYEEKHINPKIEAKVSFSASPGVTQALELLDQGNVEAAERKLKVELAKHPDDPNTLLAMTQVYQRKADYGEMNAAYARLIRFHLAHHDKEAALYSYDALLSAFPDNEINPKIPARDWLAICDYLREQEMVREAAVEYERLVNASPDDVLAVSACVLGGEAALQVHDNARALRLFQIAESLHPGDGFASRVMNGLDKARKRLDHRPTWVKQPVKPQAMGSDQDERDARF